MKASECKCIECGEQAVAFWPIIDPDIPSYPYCRKCLDKEKIQLLKTLFGENEKTISDYIHSDNNLHQSADGPRGEK